MFTFSRRVAMLVLATAFAASLAPASAENATLDAIKQRGTLKVGVKYDSPGFGLLDPKTNVVSGFDVEIARSLARRILGDAKKIEFVQVTSSNRIPLLQNGDVDMFIATATITPARMQEIDFSNVYYRAGQTLLVRKPSPIKTYKDLPGHTVCTTTGSTPELTIRRLAPQANVQTFDTYADCFTGLKSGRIDAMTTDNGILLGYEAQDPANLQVVGGLFTFEPYGIGIAKGNTTLLKAVNAALMAMAKDGEYAKIHQATLGKPAPSDLMQWFGMDAKTAGERYIAEQPKK
jgi:aspartate/glutamate/glutamine transport system substrate-binding protein